MIIGKLFTFDAAHRLPDIPCYGACRNLHGHTYHLEVSVEGDVDPERGWVMNFSELKAVIKKHVIDKYDHTLLNDQIHLPTAENIIKAIFDDAYVELKKLPIKSITFKLWETPTSFAQETFNIE